MAKILFIIAPQGYQDLEYEEPKRVLEGKGHEVITASTMRTAQGSLGGTTNTDLLLPEANAEDYDAIAFIGGPGSSIYFENSTAHTLARAFVETGKPTCAICAAPIILAKAGLLENKKSTCYPGGKDLLLKASPNTQYTGASVEKDGHIITADGPPSAKKFGKVIAKNL